MKDAKFMGFPPVVLDFLPLEAPDPLSVNDVSDDLTSRNAAIRMA